MLLEFLEESLSVTEVFDECYHVPELSLYQQANEDCFLRAQSKVKLNLFGTLLNLGTSLPHQPLHGTESANAMSVVSFVPDLCEFTTQRLLESIARAISRVHYHHNSSWTKFN